MPWAPLLAGRSTIPFGSRMLNMESLESKLSKNTAELIQSTEIPFQNVTHARVMPSTPSYFSKNPQFYELYVRASRLLTKYHQLPALPRSEAPRAFLLRLVDLRERLGENVKAAEYGKAMRIVRRLNLIVPSMRPPEVDVLLSDFRRVIDLTLNQAKPIVIDNYGRAVGVGRRKASTARAFVVEGTGEVLVNGKSLTEAFGRVHDRESAIWALTATQRIDKYNVWALVRGGGTTGQAEALTMAVAKALIVHEPALKPALRKGEWFLSRNEYHDEINADLLEQLVVSHEIGGQWKGRSTVAREPVQVKHGLSDDGSRKISRGASFVMWALASLIMTMRMDTATGTLYW